MEWSPLDLGLNVCGSIPTFSQVYSVQFLNLQSTGGSRLKDKGCMDLAACGIELHFHRQLDQLVY